MGDEEDANSEDQRGDGIPTAARHAGSDGLPGDPPLLGRERPPDISRRRLDGSRDGPGHGRHRGGPCGLKRRRRGGRRRRDGRLGRRSRDLEARPALRAELGGGIREDLSAFRAELHLRHIGGDTYKPRIKASCIRSTLHFSTIEPQCPSIIAENVIGTSEARGSARHASRPVP